MLENLAEGPIQSSYEYIFEHMLNPILLNGIPINVNHPTQYLEKLWYVLTYRYPQLGSMKVTIEDLLGYSPSLSSHETQQALNSVLGYNSEDLVVSLIDREWQDSEFNEFDDFIKYFKINPLFSSSESIYICGAGTCRLGDYLASLEHLKKVTCSDLSWLTLFYGKLLIEGQTDLLPKPSIADRLFYRIDQALNKLVVENQPSRFKPPLSRPGKIDFEVNNAFTLGNLNSFELICVPFLLDNFGGEKLESLLIRLCQSTSINQQLIIMTTFRFNHKLGKIRDPEAMKNILERCGFKIKHMDIVRLPYSFSYYNYASQKNTWNSIILGAVKKNETNLQKVRIHLNAKTTDTTAGLFSGAGMDQPAWHKCLLDILFTCQQGESYSKVFNVVKEECGLDSDSFTKATGILAHNDVLHFQI